MSRPCYIFDIDGTLADCQHRQHLLEKNPKDWNGFFAASVDDTPHEHVLNIAKCLLYRYEIVCLTGRIEDSRENTILWLRKIGLRNIPLYMRSVGDFRQDTVVKLELLAQLKADGYEPILAFEDRPRAAKAFRDAGIPCALLADADPEYLKHFSQTSPLPPATDNPELAKLLVAAKKWYDNATPEQIEQMKREQALSWARQDMD